MVTGSSRGIVDRCADRLGEPAGRAGRGDPGAVWYHPTGVLSESARGNARRASGEEAADPRRCQSGGADTLSLVRRIMPGKV
jgi:hypothetical protein